VSGALGSGFGNQAETILGNLRSHPETNRVYSFFQRRSDAEGQEASMNHSIHSADRATHLKIVVVALVAGIGLAAFAISARPTTDVAQIHVIKAGQPTMMSNSGTSLVR
jgi:hypothetical protein